MGARRDAKTRGAWAARLVASAGAMVLAAWSVPAGAQASTGGANVALASNGAVVSASSQAPGAPASALIDGDRRGLNWGNGGGWSDFTFNAHPDYVVVTFSGAKTIDGIDVFSLQDNYASPVDPVPAVTTFTKYGARNLSVSYWSGTTWVAVGSVTGNYHVWTRFGFPPVTATKIKVNVTLGGANGWTQLTEVEAWAVKPCSSACSAASSCSTGNACLNGNGALTTCGDYGICDRGTCANHCGGIAVRGCDDSCTAGGDLDTTCGDMGYVCVGSVASPSCESFCTAASACFEHCSNDGVASTCASFACEKPKLKGWVSPRYGPDVNRCVNGAVSQVQNLTAERQVRDNIYPDEFPGTRLLGDHWQTLVRLPADPDRFLITLNQERKPYHSGFIGVVQREDEQLPSYGRAEFMQQNDSVASANRYNHPGGAQALGTGYVFVAEEQQQQQIRARIRIYDQQQIVSGLSGVNPIENGELRAVSTFTLPPGLEDPTAAAAVAVAKLAPLPGESTGRYLMLVASRNYSYRVYYWISGAGAPLSAPMWGGMNFMELRPADAGEEGPSFHGWGPQQNMNILTDCSSSDLYLVSWGFDGMVRLHKLNIFFNAGLQQLQAGNGDFEVGSTAIGTNPVAVRDVGCTDGDECLFQATGSAYVTNNGGLQVHSSSKREHLRTTCLFNGDCASR